jgi:signal transduction histidine kinase
MSSAAEPRSRPTDPGRVREWPLFIAIAGGLLGLVAEHVGESWLGPAWIPIADLAVGWLMIGCGLVATVARPRQPAGTRLVLAGFLWFVGTFMGADGGVARAIGFAFGGYHDLVLAWLALSFPGSRPTGGFATWSLRVAAGLFLAQTLARLVLSGPDAFGITTLDPDAALTLVLWLDVVRAASVVVAGGVMVVHLARTHGPERRHVAPLLAAGAASAVASGFGARYALTVLGVAPDLGEEIVVPLSWAFNLVRVAVPLAILLGVLRLRAARSSLTGAVSEIGDAPTAAALRSALATALGDPGLRILTWSATRNHFVESDGQDVSQADIDGLASDPALAVIRVDGGSEPLATIVIARSLAEDPPLVAAGVALTRLVIRNEQQSARIQEQLAEVRASRARIVEAADIERRRIERDLHDGLQQRMVALAMQLRTAEGTSEQHDAALRSGSAELLAILDDVRELARGIHPAVLSEAGLAAALRAAADRSPVPAEVDLRLSGRGSAAGQATAYYVVSEALANVAKHAAAATAVWVEASDDDQRLRVVIEDDGPGGANEAGHGLAGLADRVAALDGRFSVEVGSHGGTRIVAEVPVT